MAYLQSYKELEVWKRSIALVKEIYKITRNLGEYIQFLSIADASTAELETQIIIAKDIYKKLDFSHVENLLVEVQRMLTVLIRRLNAKR